MSYQNACYCVVIRRPIPSLEGSFELEGKIKMQMHRRRNADVVPKEREGEKEKAGR